MEKIKVSKEVAYALECAIKTVGKERLFEEHCNKMQWGLEVYLPLNEISNWNMAQILINGYEVQETPEDKVLNFYKDWKNLSKTVNNGSYDDGFIRGSINSVQSVLQILNIKIKGIND